MPTVKVRNLKNEEVGEVQLSDVVFGAPLNEALIHAAVRNFMANARQGTSATKTRGDVSGAGRKLWKQKGTGRARIASLRSPAMYTDRSHVTGPTTCRRKCVRALCVPRFLSECVKEMCLLLRPGRWTNQRQKSFRRLWVSSD